MNQPVNTAHSGGEPPLDPHLKWLFEAEVLNLSKDANTGVVLLNLALSRRPFERKDMDACWFAIDTILGAIGNISKIFFPGPRRTSTEQAPRAPAPSGLRSRG